MGLLDLTSDLSKAFKNLPTSGKLEKMVNDPHASKLDYSAQPKPYKIPNNGLGVGVKYNPTTSQYSPDSKYSKIGKAGNPAGKHENSNIEITPQQLTGRHETINIEPNKMAPTPTKTAVEPIAMSATPPKQGLTPNITPLTFKRIGITPTKIPISGYTDNQPIELDNSLYSLDIGEGVLAEMDDAASKFNVDGIPESYFKKGAFDSQFTTALNNIVSEVPSELGLLSNPSLFAPLGNQPTQFPTFNPSVQVHGSNVGMSYELDLDTTLAQSSFYPDEEASIRFFQDKAKIITEEGMPPTTTGTSNRLTGDITSWYGRPVMTNMTAGGPIPGGLTGQINTITLEDQQTTGVSFFAMPGTWGGISPDLGVSTIALDDMAYNDTPGFVPNPPGNSFYVGLTLPPVENPTRYPISDGIWDGWQPAGNLGFIGEGSHRTIRQSQKFFQPLFLGGTLQDEWNMESHPWGPQPSEEGTIFDTLQTGDSDSGFVRWTKKSITGPPHDFSVFNSNSNDIDVWPSNYSFIRDATGPYSVDIPTQFRTSGPMPGLYNFNSNPNPIIGHPIWVNENNPFMDNILFGTFYGFTVRNKNERQALGGPHWNPSFWAEGTELPTDYLYLQMGEDNPSYYSIEQNEPFVNFFDQNSNYATGFATPNLALTGTPNSWTKWTEGASMPTHFTGVTEGNYENPSIYANPETYDIFSSATNFFDTAKFYANQFDINIVNIGSTSFGNTNYVNVNTQNLNYTGKSIASTSEYPYKSLFDIQHSHFSPFDIDHLGDAQIRIPTSGILPNPRAASNFSEFPNLEEQTGNYIHIFNEDKKWPYWNIISPESTWHDGESITTWNPNLYGTIEKTLSDTYATFYNSYKKSKGPKSSALNYNPKDDKGIRLLQTSYKTKVGDLSAPVSLLAGETPLVLLGAEEMGDNYYTPTHNPNDANSPTYGWGLGSTQFLEYHENRFRNPFGLKHITVLGAQNKIVRGGISQWKKEGYGTYGPTVWGSKPGATTGGLGGFTWDRNKDFDQSILYMDPENIDEQLFTSTGAGIHSMGGKTYEERMNKITMIPAGEGESFGQSLWSNLNPLDNLGEFFKTVGEQMDDTTKRWWQQHNKFSITLSNNPPKGSHRGLPSDAATGAVGKYTQLVPGFIGDGLSTIASLTARKYWSVGGYSHLQQAAELIDTGLIRFMDFRHLISDPAAVHVGLAGTSNYIDNNIHKRFGFPESGKPGMDRKMYTKQIQKMGDKITMEDIYHGNKLPNATNPADYIKFYMRDVVNNSIFRFRAYISGISDTATPNWNQYNYVGRPDPVFHYAGVGARNISFQLKVVALARQDMYYMWKKLNRLFGLCYPAGYESGGFTKGPMMELTIGDYIHHQPGFINSLTYTIPDASPWEINLEGHNTGPFGSVGSAVSTVTNVLNDPVGAAANYLTQALDNPAPPPYDRPVGSDDMGRYIAQLPHMVDISMAYTIIGEQDKRTTSHHFGTSSPLVDNSAFYNGKDNKDKNYGWTIDAKEDTTEKKGWDKVANILGF